jgi:phosphopentomutase
MEKQSIIKPIPQLDLLTPFGWQDYHLLDSGNGRKLEQYGDFVLDRPEPEAVWQPALPEHRWAAAHARFIPTPETNGGHWEKLQAMPERWQMTYQKLTFWVSLSASRHVGVFPVALMNEWLQACQLGGSLCNDHASGTEVIARLGDEHVRTGWPICYTSADSVFQIAAHEEVVPLAELYAACKVARRLCDPLRVARIIARPFVGEPGAFKRTYNRHDFGMPPPGPTLLDRVHEAKLPVVGVGKIADIFSGRGLTESIHTEGNADGMEKIIERFSRMESGLLFANLIDFDMLFGHRRNPQGFAQALREFDEALPRLLSAIGTTDLLLITADHGNDPTYRGTDHTREQVPILVYGPPRGAGHELGLRETFADVAATVAEALDVPGLPTGKSFYQEIA